jgi:hypothetical protein
MRVYRSNTWIRGLHMLVNLVYSVTVTYSHIYYMTLHFSCCPHHMCNAFVTNTNFLSLQNVMYMLLKKLQ